MNLFFDLDGTLTNPGVGIARCLQHALVSLGRPAPPAESLMRFVGPPLRATFEELLDTQAEELIQTAITLYRERFVSMGMFENEVYPGVTDGLNSLRAAGHRLWVVTSKPTVYARAIVHHFELEAYFMGVCGAELSGINADKADLIRHVLDVEPLHAQRPWMVGDRRHDIEAAHRNGLAAVGVLWGYGTEAELVAANADALVESMMHFREWVAAQQGGAADEARISCR